jgi:hypothetical protein
VVFEELPVVFAGADRQWRGKGPHRPAKESGVGVRGYAAALRVMIGRCLRPV